MEHSGGVVDWRREEDRLWLSFERGSGCIEFPATDMVRVRFAPGGELPPPSPWGAAVRRPPLPLPPHRTEAERIVIESDRLGCVIDRAAGTIAARRPSGEPFAEDAAPLCWREVSLRDTDIETRPGDELPPGPARIGVTVAKRLAEEDGVFALGEREAPLDRRYRRVSNWNVDATIPGHCRGHDNAYQSHPFALIARPGAAWGLLVDTTWYSEFDSGEAEDRIAATTLGGRLDYTVLAGPTPAAVVEQLTRLTGRPLLPPLWSLGFHQSRWSYPDSGTVREVVEAFRLRGLPLDVLHLDIDYMDANRVFTWHPERFPDPAGTVATLRSHGVRSVAILDPGIKVEEDGPDAGTEAGEMPFIGGGTPFTGFSWPGRIQLPDFARESVRRWWGARQRTLTEPGVDGIWCDMNEPAVVDRPYDEPGTTQKPVPLATLQGESGAVASHAELHNLYGAQMAQAAYDGLVAARPSNRPWVLTRSAFLGSQRHAVSWTGDNRSRWEDLALSVRQLASLGLSGMPHVGVDIGGFYENAHAELFARWMEVGAFYPFMRCHSARGTRPQEPWAFGPQTEAVARRALELRYRLLPYLYTLAHRAHRSGEPILRPLFYDFPDDEESFGVEDQFMLGPQLLVAPVLRPRQRRRAVVLPAGTWYDFWSGRQLEGGIVVRGAPPGRPPLLVRAGSVLTLGNRRVSTAEPLRELTLAAFPAARGRWTLVEDDGSSFDYREGALAETDLELVAAGRKVTLRLHRRRGGFAPAPRRLCISLHVGHKPAAVAWDGDTIDDWQWDGRRAVVEFRREDDGLEHEATVDLHVSWHLPL